MAQGVAEEIPVPLMNIVFRGKTKDSPGAKEVSKSFGQGVFSKELSPRNVNDSMMFCILFFESWCSLRGCQGGVHWLKSGVIIANRS